MITNIITHKAEETIKLGERLASILPDGITLALTGDLGAGKTTLVRGIAQGLGIEDVVQSPTFNIMKIYLKGSKPLIHIDAYRLENVNTDIGLDEYIGYETGITVIEWPNYIAKLLPPYLMAVDIRNLGGENRSFTFSGREEVVQKIAL